MDSEILMKSVQDVLLAVPHKPFLCLQMSAILYADLMDNYNLTCNVVVGSLSYKDQVIFEHDFDISGINSSSLKLWSGHAWVDFNGLIVDLSIFRTIYSEEFKKSCKDELIHKFGVGRGGIIASREQMVEDNLFYTSVQTLNDDDITGIIKGAYHLISR